MKKNFVKVLLLALVFSLIFTGCNGNLDFKKESKNKYEIEGNEATIVKVPSESTVKEIVIPDEFEGKKVTKIDDFAAVNLENVETIKIGKNVKEIGKWALENNQKLKSFEVSEENPYFCDKDGVLFTKDMKTLLFYPAMKDMKTETVTDENGEKKEVMWSEYEVPQGVEIIRTKAFYHAYNLKKLTLPDSVKRIEEKAFFRNNALEGITLPKNLEFIGKDAFGYCTSLKEITIPASVKKIETYAFYNCFSLLKIDFEGDEKSIELEKKWQPTDNGKKMDVKISFAK